MNEIEKIQIINEAAAILLLQALSLKRSSKVLMALNNLINKITVNEPELLCKFEDELNLLHVLVQQTQRDIQKTGTAQSLFIEDIKGIFGIGGGKPKNVRKGRVRKKD